MKKEAFLGAIARGARQLSQATGQRAGQAARNLTSKALTNPSQAKSVAYGAGADLAGRVARNPGAALGVAGGAAAMGTGYAMGNNKQAQEDPIGMTTNIGSEFQWPLT